LAANILSADTLNDVLTSESPPRAVANVEDIDVPPLVQHATDDAIDVRFVTV